ncbi:hypothetical protein N7517_002078 [Penicillium concentricum]|uniref:Uncharacterized protein n=1 Tax=Penicillium concentricum TaxID=293559 RepID=A0A9W9ST60_9EURO|nr:uncharacterized protein N7517_002078 [Penicillium concentricum]KAJ5384167.1 hypothetical protein N7517_002078 [Penicillium concentricum]
MACPSNRDLRDWLKDLVYWRERCHINIHQEMLNKCDNPTACRKRRMPNSDNETQDSLQSSSHSPSAGTETATKRSPERPVEESDNSVSFTRLWAELAAVKLPPRYWDLFQAVATIETMDRRWCHNHVAVRMVQHNISPSEATVIRDFMQTLSPRLSFLILGIDGESDRMVLENALAFNSATVSFQQRVNVLEEGLVKQAYMKFYTYFRKLALLGTELQEPCIKLEQEGSDSGLPEQEPPQYSGF